MKKTFENYKSLIKGKFTLKICKNISIHLSYICRFDIRCDVFLCKSNKKLTSSII